MVAGAYRIARSGCTDLFVYVTVILCNQWLREL